MIYLNGHAIPTWIYHLSANWSDTISAEEPHPLTQPTINSPLHSELHKRNGIKWDTFWQGGLRTIFVWNTNLAVSILAKNGCFRGITRITPLSLKTVIITFPAEGVCNFFYHDDCGCHSSSYFWSFIGAPVDCTISIHSTQAFVNILQQFLSPQWGILLQIAVRFGAAVSFFVFFGVCKISCFYYLK